MSALKAYQVEKFIQKRPVKPAIYLLYGNDNGLIHEYSQHLSGNLDPSGEKISNPATKTIIFDMAELDAEPSKLAVAALTTSLFGDDPVIRIRNAAKNIVPSLEELLEKNFSATIIIQAGNLTKRDKLRVLIEGNENCLALPCFSDDQQSLKLLIEQSFRDQNITISPEAVSYLCSILGNDRDITRRELEKLNNFAQESKMIKINDVQTLCGDNSLIAIDKIIDAAGIGDAQNLEVALDSAFESGVDAQLILNASSRHFLFLRTVRTKMDLGNSSASALAFVFPKPHFSRKRSIDIQLRNWNQAALANASKRLFYATLQSRQQYSVAKTIVRRTLLGICVAASRR